MKSGYQLAVKQNFPSNASCSDSTKTRWETIWSTKLPEKIKIFIWRAAQDLLPTRHNLWRSVKEAHVSQIVSRTEDCNSCSSQLQVDDLACQLAPGGYIISCTHEY